MQSLLSRLAPQRNIRKLAGGLSTTKTYQGFAFFTFSPPARCDERWNRIINPHQWFAVFRWTFCKQAGWSCCYRCHKDIWSWDNNGVTKGLQWVPCWDRIIWVNQGKKENHQGWNHVFTLQYVSQYISQYVSHPPSSQEIRWLLPAETWRWDTCWQMEKYSVLVTRPPG